MNNLNKNFHVYKIDWVQDFQEICLEFGMKESDFHRCFIKHANFYDPNPDDYFGYCEDDEFDRFELFLDENFGDLYESYEEWEDDTPLTDFIVKVLESIKADLNFVYLGHVSNSQFADYSYVILIEKTG